MAGFILGKQDFVEFLSRADADGGSLAPRRDGVGQAAEVCRHHGVQLFLEHKNSEPAMKIFMRNMGMTLHVIHTLRAQGITNVQVNMDWQHLIMNGESLGEVLRSCQQVGLTGFAEVRRIPLPGPAGVLVGQIVNLRPIANRP